MSDSPGKSCLIGLIPSLFAAAVMLAAAGSMALAEGREASEKPLLLVPPAAALAQPELPQLEFPQLKSGVIETNAGPSEAESSEEPPKSEAESAVGSGPEVGTVTATAAPATGGISEEITPGTIKGIEVNTLAAIAPDAIGTLDPDDGGFGIEMWRGSDRQVVLSLLRRLPDDLQSRNLHSLARRLLMSIAAPPSSGTELYTSEQTGLLALRLERLAILGEIPGLNDLLAAVPSHTDDQKIARLRIDSLLLVNNVDEACRQVRNGIASFHQIPYWRKAMVLCQMVAGEVDKVMLGLDLLREQGISDDPVFFALTGSMFGGEAMLPPDASLSPLHFAMLRVTGTPLPPGSLDRASRKSVV